MATTLMTMFSSFVLFVSGVIVINEAIFKLFKVENSRTKLILSWVFSIALAALGFVLQLGFFADCGPVDTWQGWVKTAFIGFGCGLAANKIYDREEIWDILEWLFSFFNKDGKAIRTDLHEKQIEKRKKTLTKSSSTPCDK